MKEWVKEETEKEAKESIDIDDGAGLPRPDQDWTLSLWQRCALML